MDYHRTVMITLVPQPISRYERSAGLLYHVRRSDAPPEKPARRCIHCGVILLIAGPHSPAKRCNACANAHVGKGHGGYSKGTLSVLVLVLACLLSVIITPVAHAQGGNLGSNSSPVVNRQGIPLPGVNIAVCQPLATTSAIVTSNLAVFTMSSNPITAGFAAGQSIL